MEKETHPNISPAECQAGYSLKFLNPTQIQMIDEALSAVGEFGEVRLIMQKGRLRFVVTQNSHDALRWEPGGLQNNNRVK